MDKARKKAKAKKRTPNIARTLERMGSDPFKGMIALASGTVPCAFCSAAGFLIIETPIPHTEFTQMETKICPKCFGTTSEYVPLETRASMLKELGQYVAPKRRAVEHALPPGVKGARVSVEFVAAPAPESDENTS